MDTVVLDPEDPTRAIIAHAATGVLGQQVRDVVLTNVHPATACQARPCVIHHPSPHRMRTWTLNWREDRGIMERLCPAHGVGHPDPDDLAYRASRSGDDGAGVHGCCGCCVSAPTG